MGERIIIAAVIISLLSYSCYTQNVVSLSQLNEKDAFEDVTIELNNSDVLFYETFQFELKNDTLKYLGLNTDYSYDEKFLALNVINKIFVDEPNSTATLGLAAALLGTFILILVLISFKGASLGGGARF